MKTKDKSVERIESLVYELLDDIVSPVCGIPSKSIWADICLATLDCYDDGAGSSTRKQILMKIARKYDIPLQSLYVYQNSALATIALVILMAQATRKGEKSRHV